MDIDEDPDPLDLYYRMLAGSGGSYAFREIRIWIRIEPLLMHFTDRSSCCLYSSAGTVASVTLWLQANGRLIEEIKSNVETK